MTTRTPEQLDLDALVALAEAATPGPWEASPNTAAGRVWVQMRTKPFPSGDLEPLFSVRSRQYGKNSEYAQREADAALIVATVNSLPALVKELREARARLAPMTTTRTPADLAAIEANVDLHGKMPTVLALMDRAETAASAVEQLRTVIAVRWQRMERLMGMNDVLRARLAKVEELADEWVNHRYPDVNYHGSALRVALSDEGAGA